MNYCLLLLDGALINIYFIRCVDTIFYANLINCHSICSNKSDSLIYNPA